VQRHTYARLTLTHTHTHTRSSLSPVDPTGLRATQLRDLRGGPFPSAIINHDQSTISGLASLPVGGGCPLETCCSNTFLRSPVFDGREGTTRQGGSGLMHAKKDANPSKRENDRAQTVSWLK